MRSQRPQTHLGNEMQRYYFDTYEDGQVIADEVGVELEGIDAARREAAVTLPAIMQDAPRMGQDTRITFVVREEGGGASFTATMTLSFGLPHAAEIHAPLTADAPPSF
jgi:hypothetical protein